MEQRRFKRVSFLQQVDVNIATHSYETQCMDISLRGVLLLRPANATWQIGQELDVRITLAPEEIIDMHCTLMHLDTEVAGCECSSIDIDSLTTLRRLLELNLANPQEVNRELADLLR